MMIAESHLEVIKSVTNFSDIINIKLLQGGDINSVYHIKRKQTDFIVKINSVSLFPDMFLKEAEGLNELRKSNTFVIPEIIGHGVCNDYQYLILEYILPISDQDDIQLGQKLAAMHQLSSEKCGFYNDNYIGSLLQVNTQNKNGIQFIIENRWGFQVNRLPKKSKEIISPKMELVIKNIREIIPSFKPALLHGDLWSGNYFYSHRGHVLIDPAVYYGNPITDIAMMKLFGGFSNSFFESYNHHADIDKNWEKLIPLFQIYPLLVHVNLFGSSYLRDLNTAIENYI